LLIVLSLGWGVVAAWTVALHQSAAGAVVNTNEPLSLDAQQIYQSLSDAQVTVSAAFLASPDEPLAARQRYDADIARATAGLKAATAASVSPQLSRNLAMLSTGLPQYTAEVANADLYNSLGYLAGSSSLQVATEEMQLTLLPAARAVYTQENAQLTATSAQATGLPLVVLTLVIGLVLLFVLFRVQRWLTRRTRRIVNYGLLLASAATALSVLWLVVSFTVARVDLGRALQHGSQPAATLAEAGIAAQRARGDEILNLVSHSGDTAFQADFHAAQAQLGPGAGSLLASALDQHQGGTGAARIQAAAQEATSWYAVNQKVHALDTQNATAAETQLVTGTGPGTAATLFGQIDANLSAAMAADEATFRSSAATGRDAFTGLEAGIIVLALVMVLGCAWGINRRLAEYR
jgi:predicted PurR-regulated permease PerM